MNNGQMTSLKRILTTLSHQEPDRVPFLLPATMHGAKELGFSLKEYFSKAENVIEGQLRLREKYRHDGVFAFFYGPLEIEAWGGKVIFSDNGPVNSGEPFIRDKQQIVDLEPPHIDGSPELQKVLKTIEILKTKLGDEAPVFGVVMSPFSLPVMQMGFDKYFDLLYEEPQLFDRLMRVNEDFAVSWANAQMKAGTTAVVYFDPVSSPTICPRELYLKTGFEVAKRTIARINGPTVTHLASGRCLSIVDDLTQTGTVVVGTSVLEDLKDVKNACRNKLTVLGNLNGIEMRRWAAGHAEDLVKDAIRKAGPGGGFILADNHGEIPYQVPDEVLLAISAAVHKWGRYPIKVNDKKI